MNQRLWIDVTDFLKWHGNFTAFQHIQYRMAKLYIESRRSVAFFVYDEPTRSFKQVNFDPDRFSADGMRTERAVSPPPSLLRTVKRLTPKPLKVVLKKVIRPSSSAHPSASPAAGRSPFSEGETVLVLGGIWHGTFADDITREKRKKGFKFVHIVHDMIPVVVPQYVVEDLPKVFEAYKDKIFRIADGLIINSESSKKDALVFMEGRGIKPPPLVVFRLADARTNDTAPEAVEGLEPGKFLLSLGTVEGRKNHQLLYYAYKQAVREGVRLPKMVIAGRRGWLVDDLYRMLERDPDIKDQFVILDGVPNSQRSWLFDNCLFFVWPSFYEGWGMPVAEALTYGKVCVSSDTSSMPEIGGKLLDYFSPFSTDECLRAIQKHLDTKTRQARESRIKREYRVTTWEDMFMTISEFIDRV